MSTTTDGRPLSRLQSQNTLCSSIIPDDVADTIKVAASEAAIAVVAVAAGEAATASGLEPGTAELVEQHMHLQAEYQEELQQQFEMEYHQQYRDHRFNECQHQHEQYQQAQQQEDVSCVTDPVNVAGAADVIGWGRVSGSPVLNDGPNLNNSKHTSSRSSREDFAGAGASSDLESTDDLQHIAVVPHYARPLASRSPEAGRLLSAADGRRTSAAEGRRSSAANGGNTSDIGSLPHPGTSSAAASRRTTREGPGGFCATSAPGGAFNKYERGLGDGVQQEYRVLAAEAVLAAGRGPSLSPPKPRKSDLGGRSGCNEGATCSQGSVRQHESFEADISMKGHTPAVRRSINKRFPHVSSAGVLDQLQQQMQSVSRAAPDELVQPTQCFSYSSPGAASSKSCILAGSSNSYDPAEAAAAIAAAIGLKQETSVTATAAASGRTPAAMQGLVLGPDGTWQQEQQQSRADAWFDRLKAQRKAGRQPWDQTNVRSGISLSGQLSRQGSSEMLGLNPSDQGSDRLPSGKCGTRASVHNAWLYIDGRATAALPWQALAAATAAKSGPLPPGNNRAANFAAALAAAEAFMSPGDALGESHLRQLSVKGKRLLVKLMWLKSAAGVLRRLGRDPQTLESRMWQLLKKTTGPAGAELLLWSIADQKQQQSVAQQQRLLQQALQASNGAGPAAVCLENRIGVVGGRGCQQHVPTFSGAIYSAAGNSPGLSGAGFNADLLGQYLPLLPAARSKALGSRPQQQGPYHQHQQQKIMLAQLQLLQWQNQQQVQGAGWPRSLQGHQQDSIQGLQHQHNGSSVVGAGQIPMAHKMQFAQCSGHRHGSPPPEAAAGRPVGQHDGGCDSQSGGCERDNEQHSAAYGKLPYNAQQVGRGWGDRGNSALALYGSRSVLLQAREAAHGQQEAAGYISNQWQSVQQQQVQQRRLQQDIPCADTVLVSHSTTIQKLLPVAELGWQPRFQQQPINPANKLTHHCSTQQAGRLHPYRTLSERPSVSLNVSATGAAEQVNTIAGRSGTQHRPGVSFNGALSSAVERVDSTTEVEPPVHVSFVASNRYQQQLKSQRRKSVGSLMPSRSADFAVQHQQPLQQPEEVHQYSEGWAPRVVQDAPSVSFAPTSTAGGSKQATVHTAGTYSPRQRSSVDGIRGLEPMQGVQQKQQQPVQKQVLKTSLVGGLPVMATGSLDGFRLQPGSLQAFLGQQLQQQQEKYSYPPSIDMLVRQQRQQQQHDNLGREQEFAKPSLRSAVGSLAGATDNTSAREQQQRPSHGRSPEPDAPNVALGVRLAAASQKALCITIDGVQWQGQRQILGASQNGGSNVTLSVAHPELPQLAALRVCTEGRTAAQ